jgi:polyhydroxyalkanoate synthesis regulator phasin
MSDKMRDDGHETATKSDLSAMRGDIATMRDDITAVMRSDIAAVRDDITSAMRGDIVAMRGDIVAMRDDIAAAMREQLRPIVATLAHHTAELADIRGHIKDKLVTRGEFHSRMDAYAGLVGDFEYSSAKNLSRLDEHEERIKALEDKSA